MSRIATIWLHEFAKAMRENDIIECEKHTEYKNGKKETIRLVLGPKTENSVIYDNDDNVLLNTPIESDDVLLKKRKRDIYYDLFGQKLSDEELSELPDQIKQIS